MTSHLDELANPVVVIRCVGKNLMSLPNRNARRRVQWRAAAVESWKQQKSQNNKSTVSPQLPVTTVTQFGIYDARRSDVSVSFAASVSHALEIYGGVVFLSVFSTS